MERGKGEATKRRGGGEALHKLPMLFIHTYMFMMAAMTQAVFMSLFTSTSCSNSITQLLILCSKCTFSITPFGNKEVFVQVLSASRSEA